MRTEGSTQTHWIQLRSIRSQVIPSGLICPTKIGTSKMNDFVSLIKIEKGLVIRDPWIGKILSGQKTWEMRSWPTRQRELCALIRKGSGKVVGLAELADCRPAIATLSEYAMAERYHQIPPAEQPSAWDKIGRYLGLSEMLSGSRNRCLAHIKVVL